MHLINIFDDIANDFEKIQYVNSKVLSRRFQLHNGMVILVNMHKCDLLEEVGYLLNDNYSIQLLKRLPKWKGMEQRISNISYKEKSEQFLMFTQLPNYEHKIFSLVMQDIVDSLEGMESNLLAISNIKEILVKWNTFFQFDKEYVLSDNKQQGLYGELYILEKMIILHGKNFINNWTGCNAEVHDFYFETNAIEVKSSSTKGPDKIKISNEYQLDDSKLIGKLYLLFLKLKKSEVDGESLPDIVDRISKLLSESDRIEFNNKLIKVGYIYQMPELYKLFFKVIDESCYEVVEGFPRITTKALCKGIGKVEYTVSLDACNQFQIMIEDFYKGVKLF